MALTKLVSNIIKNKVQNHLLSGFSNAISGIGNPKKLAAKLASKSPLDFSKSPLRRYMIDAMKYWIKEIDIDGFRCDVAGMVPNDFWEKSIKELNQIKIILN